MIIGMGVSCRISYSSVSYLYVSCSGSISSVEEERELIFLLSFTCNYVGFSLGAWNRLRYFIMALPGPSI